jgi:uncharacterized Ntn-hydrolase superfamily protein
MRAHTMTVESFVAADEQTSESLGGRLIRLIVAGQQRKADRRILMYLPNHDSYRNEFGVELERRLLGQ